MDPLDILAAVEATKGKNSKQDTLREHRANKELAELLDAALNFKRKFHIKKFSEYKHGNNVGWNGSPSHVDFMSLLDKLEKRETTGNKATEIVEDFFKNVSNFRATWYARVLRKDLKSGFGISTANKAGFGIPIFEVQLAKDGKECKKLNSILDKGAFASPKLDGYRCLAVIHNGDVTLYSRNGTEYPNFPTIVESLTKTWGDKDMVLDGEIMSMDFNSMQQTAFSSKSHKSVGDVVYHIFDTIPADEWRANKFKATAKNRYDCLSLMFVAAKMDNTLSSNLREVQHLPVATLDEILKLEKQFISRGYEGVMVNPDISYYKGKKSNKMLKFKTMKSMEATVVSCYKGELGTKYEGTLGGFHVMQENNVTCDIGGGFSDSDRDYIWQNQKTIEGRVLEAAYQELTDKGRMRFPIFKRWRLEKEE